MSNKHFVEHNHHIIDHLVSDVYGYGGNKILAIIGYKCSAVSTGKGKKVV